MVGTTKHIGFRNPIEKFATEPVSIWWPNRLNGKTSITSPGRMAPTTAKSLTKSSGKGYQCEIQRLATKLRLQSNTRWRGASTRQKGIALSDRGNQQRRQEARFRCVNLGPGMTEKKVTWFSVSMAGGGTHTPRTENGPSNK